MNNKELIMPDGTLITSLIDLYFWIINADEHLIKLLINENDNKLYRIIREFFGDEKLSEELKFVKNKEDILIILRKHVFTKREIDEFTLYDVYEFIKESSELK